MKKEDIKSFRISNCTGQFSIFSIYNPLHEILFINIFLFRDNHSSKLSQLIIDRQIKTQQGPIWEINSPSSKYDDRSLRDAFYFDLLY